MIETERLIIKPLTYGQLLKYIKADNSLELELELNETSRTISPELKEALEQTILPNVSDTKNNYLYSTLWTVISKKENQMPMAKLKLDMEHMKNLEEKDL